MYLSQQDVIPVQDSSAIAQTVRFSIRQWAAWAPGLESPEAWYRWACGEATIYGEGKPRAAAVPPMLRRRAGLLGRMALETAYASIGDRGMIPTVFCSRHGDIGRTCEMLMALAQNEALSPTAFSLSVHNAIGALFSIATGSHVPFTAIAGGIDGVAGGIIEACGQLADGEREVLLVVYDTPLPIIYQPYRDEPEFAYAWAWRMTPPSGESFSLAWETRGEEVAARPHAAPLALEIMRFFLSGLSKSTIDCGRQAWRWRRHA
jgi:hypothetical protein